jgi:hypothetical protein
MMRSFENRSDCTVVDEPFYAFYLHNTGHVHPMQEEVLASQPTHYDEVARLLSNDEQTSSLQYQKHMTQHMPQGCDLNWAATMRHCFLIRDPALVVDSYTRSRGQCSAQDIGIKRQYELYQELSTFTQQPIPILDSASVLANPELALKALCEQLNIPFQINMLKWPSGQRDSDGVWAGHWYHSVEASTGFSQSSTPVTSPELNAQQRTVVDEVQEYYEALKEMAIDIG